MSRESKPFTFTLTDAEAAEITSKEINGPGGLQSMMRRFAKELETGKRDLTLNDVELGALVRYMTRYGGGGFEDRLHNAFARSLRQLLRL